jgi:hypothetical protein
LSLAAPALAASGGLPAEVSNFGDEYPFSVAVEAALAVKDVLAMNRDHYEGDDCSTRAKKEKKKKKEERGMQPPAMIVLFGIGSACLPKKTHIFSS